MNFNRSLVLCWVATLCVVVSGCGGGGTGDAPPPSVVVAVDGTLTVDAEPYGPALLLLESSSDSNAPALEIHVKEGGKFTEMVYSEVGQTPSGQFNVMLVEDPEHMEINGVPTIEPASIEITLPAEGEPYALQIAGTSNGEGMTSGGPSLSVDGL